MSATTPTAPTTTDLVRFLLARLDDDDAQLRREARSGVAVDGAKLTLDRRRSESLARRQVVGHVQHLLVLRDQPNEKAVRDTAALILRSLSMPYLDHPSYRDEWRVSVR